MTQTQTDRDLDLLRRMTAAQERDAQTREDVKARAAARHAARVAREREGANYS